MCVCVRVCVRTLACLHMHVRVCVRALVCAVYRCVIIKVSVTISYVDHIGIIDQCPDVVGSLDHNSGIILPHRTFILVGYTVPCSGTVVAWEFCHHHFSNAASVTFYPGIWKPINISNNTIFELIQSNNVTYNPRNAQPGPYPCHIFSVSDANQFVAPAGSVVGLYSNTGAQLLRTNTSNIITAHQFLGNQSNVSMNAGNDNNYNIAIKVHLSKSLCDAIILLHILHMHDCMYVC